MNEPYIALNCVSGDLKFKIPPPPPPTSLAPWAVPSPELPPKQIFLDRTLIIMTHLVGRSELYFPCFVLLSIHTRALSSDPAGGTRDCHRSQSDGGPESKDPQSDGGPESDDTQSDGGWSAGQVAGLVVGLVTGLTVVLVGIIVGVGLVIKKVQCTWFTYMYIHVHVFEALLHVYLLAVFYF